MRTRYDGLVELLREAAQPERVVPPAAAAYVAKVRADATTVTDADIRELRAAGLGEDEIFELTVSTAVAAGLARLEAGLGALA